MTEPLSAVFVLVVVVVPALLAVGLVCFPPEHRRRSVGLSGPAPRFFGVQACDVWAAVLAAVVVVAFLVLGGVR